MLETLDGKLVTSVPHRADFDDLIRRLGTKKADAIRDFEWGSVGEGRGSKKLRF